MSGFSIRLLFMACLLAAIQLPAQSLFEKSAGFTGRVSSMITCSDGGFAYSGNAEADSGNLILARYTSAGTRLWQQEIGTSAVEAVHDFVQTADGGFVAVGKHWDNEFGMLVVKVDSLGNLLWVKKLSHGLTDRANSVCATADGGLLVVGETESNLGVSSTLVVKLTSSGTVSWVRELSGFIDGGYSVLQMFNGRFVVTGQTNAGALDNIGVVCFDSVNVYWSFALGSAAMDVTSYNHQLVQTSDSCVVFSGTSWTIAPNAADIFVAKISASGVPNWMRTFGTTSSEFATSLTAVSNGVIIGGYVQNDGGASTDPVVVKIQLNGLPAWGYVYPGQDYNPLFGITALPAGDIIAGGASGNGSTLDQATLWRFSSAGNTCNLKSQYGTVSFLSAWFGFPVVNTASTVFSFPIVLAQQTTAGETALCSCAGSVPVTATVPVSTFCYGSSTTLNHSTQPGYQYQLYRNNVLNATGNGAGFTLTQGGNYFVVQKNGCAVDTSNAINLNVTPTPSVSISASGRTKICSGHSVNLLANSQLGVQYQWMLNGVNIPGATQVTYPAAQTGDYSVRVGYASTGCSKTSTSTQVIVQPAPPAAVTANGPTSFCNGDSVVLQANNGSGYTYQWRKNGNPIAGAATLTYSAKSAGTYKVRVKDTNGCTQLSSGVVVSVPCRTAADISDEPMVYPNPAAEILNVEIPGSRPCMFSLTDVQGRRIAEGILQPGKNALATEGLAAGLYLLNILEEEHSFSMRIQVRR